MFPEKFSEKEIDDVTRELRNVDPSIIDDMIKLSTMSIGDDGRKFFYYDVVRKSYRHIIRSSVLIDRIDKERAVWPLFVALIDQFIKDKK